MEVRRLQVALANIGAPPLLPSRDRQCLGAITEQNDRATIVALFVSQAVRPRGAEVVEVTPVDLAGWNYQVSAGEGVVADQRSPIRCSLTRTRRRRTAVGCSPGGGRSRRR